MGWTYLCEKKPTHSEWGYLPFPWFLFVLWWWLCWFCFVSFRTVAEPLRNKNEQETKQEKRRLRITAPKNTVRHEHTSRYAVGSTKRDAHGGNHGVDVIWSEGLHPYSVTIFGKHHSSSSIVIVVVFLMMLLRWKIKRGTVVHRFYEFLV